MIGANRIRSLQTIGEMGLLIDETLKRFCRPGGEGKRVVDVDIDGYVEVKNLSL